MESEGLYVSVRKERMKTEGIKKDNREKVRDKRMEVERSKRQMS